MCWIYEDPDFPMILDWFKPLRISREVQEIITTTINIEFEKVCEELSVLQSIKESIDHFFHLYDSVKRELEEAKEEIKNLKRDNCELRNILNSHSDVINNLEKEARASNIELHCLPEFRNENLVNTVEQISKVINVPITEGGIIKCTRVAKQNKNSSRPRTVIVKFSTPITRDRFLAGVINYNKRNTENKLNTSHLGISGEKTPVFISEHLTSASRDIHAAARLFAKEKQYRYVWSRNGNIFLRKSAASDVIFVKSKNILKTLD
ncbi:unnamed protein product [Euphydryas editha]|uniref:FP protein C-terminal domain-containing protein n=1 Tax=Euphydryas editha TaxID=104508 RepID=A0AAU9UE47_EUPED|nr:unnamed protein product [Euphydryas editha]